VSPAPAEEIQEQVAKVESDGDLAQGMIRASAKLSSMGVEEDIIAGLTAIDAVEDGTMDSSLCEATAQVMHAELGKVVDRDDDVESVRSSSAVAAAAVQIAPDTALEAATCPGRPKIPNRN
jgi:hypothetical protein